MVNEVNINSLQAQQHKPKRVEDQKEILPEPIREQIYQDFGMWIRYSRLIRRALPQVSNELIEEYQQRVAQPSSSTRDTMEGLMEDRQVALLACSLIAPEVLNNLKPSVSFSEEVQGGDNTPYSVILPVRKEEGDP
ncbi:unnamed protein product [Lota lota]